MNPAPKTRCDPFAWQDKRMLRRIREQCEDPASAFGVYVALTIVASDQEREEFQTTHKWLASLCGFSERTVRARLPDLERIQAVQVIASEIKGPSTYRLLPSGNDCRTSGNGCRRFGNGGASPLPPSEVIEVKKSLERPRTTAERIGIENKVKILKERLADLEGETSEQWQRDAQPGLVMEKQKVRAEIKALENSLL